MIQLPSDGDSSGRDLGEEELALLKEAIASGHLTSTRGTMVPRLEEEFAKVFGVDRAIALASGSAAVHTAVAAVDPEPGDEVITTPITDMGAITAILLQGAIPIFADVDPVSLNVTAETIRPRITKNTKAIIVTHLFGNPCDMDPILALAKEHGIPVIEDAAQAFMATYKGKLCGTIGDIGCFSFQQSKHMTSGEGGIVVSNNPDYARRMFLFVNKAWGYGDSNPDHYFLAPNYRMTELQGAVLVPQLAKLPGVVERRNRTATRLSNAIASLSQIEAPVVTAESKHVYWRYPIRIAAQGDDLTRLAGAIRERGVQCAPRYISKPAFECQVIRDRVSFGKSKWPWEGPHMAGRDPIVYDPKTFPGAYDGLAHVIVIPWNEFFTDDLVDSIAEVIAEAERNVLGTGV
ncbi:MAG: DegT/DnrJ/EryC1/StrS family aminotransferase [Candidatus Eisenbacteria bacterium]|uniref:DegT/DnrJ/EryC1/StrS family aminotransferase n=1 Tax=Eiseniibacteriota bacterium TaxID=2212470 RepID=A0A956NI65_UNCEI|nr:DegT/DnrJ/EryC1/StrS family aminotransferase [Candidatus Eisenbacteria bacterium]MCB9463993.1 DegT/DnrJ/EryC1/StrS family aminotransferase [Candidatus Eisenbacteria bacterium]